MFASVFVKLYRQLYSIKVIVYLSYFATKYQMHVLQRRQQTKQSRFKCIRMKSFLNELWTRCNVYMVTPAEMKKIYYKKGR